MKHSKEIIDRIYRDFYKPYCDGLRGHVKNEAERKRIVDKVFNILRNRADQFSSEDDMTGFIEDVLFVLSNRLDVVPGSADDHIDHAVIMFDVHKLPEEELRESFRLFLKKIAASIAAFWSGKN